MKKEIKITLFVNDDAVKMMIDILKETIEYWGGTENKDYYISVEE